MKALILCGSGNREGFTNAMCQGAERALSSDGWDVDVLRPYDMDVRHCNGCLGCRKDGRCVIDDDMGEIYSLFEGADLLILATPIQFSGPSSVLKTVVDRFNPYWYRKGAHPSRCAAMMCGGSMMYIDAVCNGIDDIPTVDDETRRLMKMRLEQEGLPALVEELKRVDPEHWEIVDHNNPRRVVHALEICHSTGKTYSSFRTNTVKERPFNIIKIGLTAEREQLYDRINLRVRDMVANGMVEEARRVYPMRELNALNTVGYKELFEHFDGTTTLEEAIVKIQGNTRRYCRKQLTWFKRDDNLKWFTIGQNIKEIINYIDKNR